MYVAERFDINISKVTLSKYSITPRQVTKSTSGNLLFLSVTSTLMNEALSL